MHLDLADLDLIRLATVDRINKNERRVFDDERPRAVIRAETAALRALLARIDRSNSIAA